MKKLMKMQMMNTLFFGSYIVLHLHQRFDFYEDDDYYVSFLTTPTTNNLEKNTGGVLIDQEREEMDRSKILIKNSFLVLEKEYF